MYLYQGVMTFVCFPYVHFVHFHADCHRRTIFARPRIVATTVYDPAGLYAQASSCRNLVRGNWMSSGSFKRRLVHEGKAAEVL